MAPRPARQQSDFLDVSTVSLAHLKELGNSVIALELVELLTTGLGTDEVYAAFDNSTSAPHGPGIS
jgi:hypothetical protein